MRLTDMVDLIGQKTGLVGDDNEAACKIFLKARHEMIFNSQLWIDSIYMLTIVMNRYGMTVNGDGSLNTDARTTAYNALSDAAKLAAQNQAYGVFLLPNIANRVLGVRQVNHRMDVVARESIMRMDFDQFNIQGDSSNWFELPPVALSFPYVPVTTLSFTHGAEAGINLLAKWTDGLSAQRSATYDLTTAGTSVLDSSGVQVEIRSITKNVTASPVYVGNLSGGSVTANSSLVTLAATDTAAPIRQRFQILPYPSADFTLRALVKINCPSFTDDSDEPAIRNMSNVLIAFGMSDMWSRARQLGKAGLFAQEGTALLDQLIELETVQSGHSIQVIPEDGYGNSYFGPDRTSSFGVFAP